MGAPASPSHASALLSGFSSVPCKHRASTCLLDLLEGAPDTVPVKHQPNDHRPGQSPEQGACRRPLALPSLDRALVCLRLGDGVQDITGGAGLQNEIGEMAHTEESCAVKRVSVWEDTKKCLTRSPWGSERGPL